MDCWSPAYILLNLVVMLDDLHRQFKHDVGWQAAMKLNRNLRVLIWELFNQIFETRKCKWQRVLYLMHSLGGMQCQIIGACGNIPIIDSPHPTSPHAVAVRRGAGDGHGVGWGEGIPDGNTFILVGYWILYEYPIDYRILDIKQITNILNNSSNNYFLAYNMKYPILKMTY